MHPGWVDTPALREAMPDFHKKFENSLKDEDEGADTIVWLSTMPF
jgi:dehydrogenase/reductase SDR family protein 12